MKFTYTTINKKGERESGTSNAKDKFELAHKLKLKGLVLVDVVDFNNNGDFNMSKINAILSRVKMQDKIVFAHNLGVMIKAGLSLSRSIAILGKQTKNEKFKNAIQSLGNEIKNGSSLNMAMRKFPKIFSNLFVAMVRAGEESGSLSETLEVVGEQMNKSYQIKKKIKGAMIYPSIVITAMIIVGILMLIFVVPTLTSTFKDLGVDLPISTQIVVLVSDFLSGHTIASLLTIILSIVFAKWISKTKKGSRAIDFLIIRIPIVGELIKKTNSARTARTLSSLLSSGVDIIKALEITKEVIQNSYYKEVLEDAKNKIQKGKPLSASFSSNVDLYPILVGEMIEVGEETGRLTDMLIQVAEFYEDEVDSATKNMSTIIEPFLMVVVGVVVGFFAISMITPTYSLLDSI
jgi:type IV pilus assembly protein PilC